MTEEEMEISIINRLTYSRDETENKLIQRAIKAEGELEKYKAVIKYFQKNGKQDVKDIIMKRFKVI